MPDGENLSSLVPLSGRGDAQWLPCEAHFVNEIQPYNASKQTRVGSLHSETLLCSVSTPLEYASQGPETLLCSVRTPLEHAAQGPETLLCSVSTPLEHAAQGPETLLCSVSTPLEHAAQDQLRAEPLLLLLNLGCFRTQCSLSTAVKDCHCCYHY